MPTWHTLNLSFLIKELHMRLIYNLLISALVLLCMTFQVSFAKSLNPFKFLPKDGNFLFQIDVKRIQNSQTFKDLYTFVSSNPANQKALQEFNTTYQIDLLKDIDTVTFHASSPNKDAAEPELLVILEGRFKPEVIIEATKKTWTQPKQEMIGSATFVYSELQKENAMSFVDQMLVLGNQSAVRQAISKSGQFSGKLADSLSKLPTTPVDTWGVMVLNENMKSQLRQNNPNAASFENIIMSFDLASGLNVDIKAYGENETMVSALSNEMNAQLTSVLQNPQAAIFASMIKKLKISAKAKELQVQLPLDQQDVNQIKMMLAMMLGGLNQMNQAPVNTSPIPSNPNLNQPAPSSMVVPMPAPAPVPAPVPAPTPAPAPAPVPR
jgi:hypothetical protein